MGKIWAEMTVFHICKLYITAFIKLTNKDETKPSIKPQLFAD